MAQGLINAKNLLHFNRSDAPKPAAPPAFDYNRPIHRSSPSTDHSKQIRRALEEARKERQVGHEGSADIVSAIRTMGMPPEKEDPFGIYSNPGPGLPPPSLADGGNDSQERGRTRFHLGHMRIDSKARSKSQERRDSIKKRIRVVSEVDPDAAIGVGLVGGVMGSAAVYSPTVSTRSRAGTFEDAFSSPDSEGRGRSGSNARWEKPRVVPGAVGYTPIPAPHKIHDGIGPGTTHAALAAHKVHRGVAKMDFAPGGLEAQRTW